MDRFVMSLLLSIIGSVLIPSWWQNQHTVLYIFVEGTLFTLGFFIYKFEIIKKNFQNFRSRWRWNVEKRGFLHWVAFLSWLVAPFSLWDWTTTPKEQMTYSLSASRLVSEELFLLVGSAVIFFLLIIFPDDQNKMWQVKGWTDEQERVPLRNGFHTLWYLFPIPAIALGAYLVVNRGKPLINLYTSMTQSMRGFAIKRGLSEEASTSEHLCWWIRALARLVFAGLTWIFRQVFVLVCGIILVALHIITELTIALLRPTQHRTPLFLFEVVTFLLFAKAYARDMTHSLVQGMIVGGLHTLVGFWLGEKLRRLLDSISSTTSR